MHIIHEFSPFYSYFQVTSAQVTSLPGQFRSPEVTWRRFLWCNCLLLRSTALLEVKCTVYASFWPYTATSRLLPVKMTSLSGHFRSPEVTWRRFLSRDASYELQPCRKWNARDRRVSGLLQPLPGDLCSNDVSSESLSVTWGHM